MQNLLYRIDLEGGLVGSFCSLRESDFLKDKKQKQEENKLLYKTPPCFLIY